MSAKMADCKAAQTQQSNEGGGGLWTPSEAFQCAKCRWWGDCGMSAMAPSAGLWGCSIVGAVVAVHLWGAGGSALLLEGRWRRLPTRGQPHLSRSFNNTRDGRSVERGGDEKMAARRMASWQIQEDERRRRRNNNQPANKRQMGGKLPSRNPDLGCRDAAMAFGVVALPLRRRGRHRHYMTSSSSSLSPGGIVATNDDDDDEDDVETIGDATDGDFVNNIDEDEDDDLPELVLLLPGQRLRVQVGDILDSRKARKKHRRNASRILAQCSILGVDHVNSP